MKKKDKTTYIKIFKYLKNKGLKSMKNLIVDFEIAISLAVKECFPQTKLYGCLFHFGQIMWHQIQKLGFSSLYKNEAEFKRFVNYHLLLAYVPVKFVADEFKKLQNSRKDRFQYNEISNSFYKNFIKYQINLINKNINFWNVHERILLNIPTTTNSLEAWHSHINNKIKRNHPNICAVIEILKREERKTKIIVENLKSGNQNTINKKLQTSVKNIVVNYSCYRDLEFFEYLFDFIHFIID